jgi:hypothetical protein
MMRKTIILAGAALSLAAARGALMAQEKPGVVLPKVVMGCPQTVVYGVGLVGGTQLLRLANGDIVLPGQRWDTKTGTCAESWVMVSSDKGKTWRKAPGPWPLSTVAQLRDGTVLGLAYATDGPPKKPGIYTYKTLRGMGTWDSLKEETVTADVPEATTGTGDDLRPFHGMLLTNSLVEMPDGLLLATAYGYFKGDDVPIEITFEPYRPKNYPVPGYNKYRTVLLKSSDKGHTWKYFSTVAYDPSSGDEGPCEPSMVRLDSGELVCIMRTGRVTGLRIARSPDGGKTWSPLQVIAGTIGVAPWLIRTHDGALACVYGMKEDYWKGDHRRELRVMFSFDGGRTWPLNEIVYAGEASSYGSICEIEPGRLLIGFSSPGLFTPPEVQQPSFICVVPVQFKQPPTYPWP